VLKSYISSAIEVNCYIFEAGDRLYCIHNSKGSFGYHRFDNAISLTEHMSKSQGEYRSVVFDVHALRGHVLKAIYSRNKKGTTQLFLLSSKESVVVYVLDELGVLFHQKMPVDDVQVVAKHFIDFIDALLEKNRLQQEYVVDSSVDTSTERLQINDEIEVYKLIRDDYHYNAKSIELPEEVAVSSYSVQVIGEVVDKKTVFTFYCDDAEFSTAESGNEIFQVVAKHILKQRSKGEKYYVYITDLDLSPSLVGDDVTRDIPIVKHLKYKKNIESKLNAVLAKM
jgi:adenylate cyclase class 1